MPVNDPTPAQQLVLEPRDTSSSTAGRAAAFRRLSGDQLAASYRLARAILHDPGEAEDAVQDAFEQAWRRWPQLRDPARVDAWFQRILVNTCRNRLRSRRGKVFVDVTTEVALRAPGDPFGDTHDREVVGRAMAGLDPDCRITVALRFFADLSIEEIATRTGVPAGTVKSRLHRALQQLHGSLELAGAQAR